MTRFIETNQLAERAQRLRFDSLCLWIEEHIDEQIGWQEMTGQSGLEFPVIHALFYKYKSTTAMAFIRQRRMAAQAASSLVRPSSWAPITKAPQWNSTPFEQTPR